jgi:diguanylate cyclase (GGDEF)-like protein
MPEFTRSEAKALGTCVGRFIESYRRDVDDVISRQFRGLRPAEVTELLGQLSILERQLEVRQKPVRVHDAYSGLLKRILIDQRRENAEAIDVPLQKAVDGQMIAMLKRDLHFIEHIMQAPWFQEAEALRVPELTDYLSIRHAEAALPEPLVLRAREYDEKFHILEAPSLFLPDLGYYRKRCRFRGAPISVAYIDIDDFKAFNTKYTETKVDLNLLTPFMEAIEAHIFSHGHAYRFGGDEYLLTLPNMGRAWADDFLKALQVRVAETSYRGITRPPTISIGLCVIDVDCFLTDREVLARANQAKNHAKATQKGRIAAFDGVLFRDSDLALL